MPMFRNSILEMSPLIFGGERRGHVAQENNVVAGGRLFIVCSPLAPDWRRRQRWDQ